LSLTAIVIPKGVITFGYGAFDGCQSLKSIMFHPAGYVRKICDLAFRDAHHSHQL
jgi:hypothetical protein